MMEPSENLDSPSPVWPPPPTVDAPVPAPAPPSLWHRVLRRLKRTLPSVLGCFLIKIIYDAYKFGGILDRRVWLDVFTPEKFVTAFVMFFVLSLIGSVLADFPLWLTSWYFSRKKH